MIDEDAYVIGSGDPGLDFARTETKFRGVLRENLNSAESNSSISSANIEYINHTLAIADELGLDIFDGITVPYHSDQNSYEVSLRVQTIADGFKARVNVAKALGRSRYTVLLTYVEKSKIRHWADLIRNEIEKTTDKEIKRDLLSALNVFLAKLDKDRTPLQAFTDFVLTVSATVGVAGDNIEPWWKWIGSIANVFGVNVQASQPRLAKPQTQLRLEDKKSRFSNEPQEAEEEPF